MSRFTPQLSAAAIALGVLIASAFTLPAIGAGATSAGAGCCSPALPELRFGKTPRLLITAPESTGTKMLIHVHNVGDTDVKFAERTNSGWTTLAAGRSAYLTQHQLWAKSGGEGVGKLRVRLMHVFE